MGQRFWAFVGQARWRAGDQRKLGRTPGNGQDFQDQEYASQLSDMRWTHKSLDQKRWLSREEMKAAKKPSPQTNAEEEAKVD